MAVQTRLSPAETYEVDFSDWSVTQADALQRHAVEDLDWANLAEEIGSLSRSDKQAIWSHLEILLMHLAKWAVQPERRGTSRRTSIRQSRRAIERIVDDSPSLAPYPGEILNRAFKGALVDAADEMGMSVQLSVPGWSIEQIMDEDFFPDSF